MTALTDTVALLTTRHDAVALAYEWAVHPDWPEALAGDALDQLGIDPAAAALEAAQVPSMRLVLDVVVWSWVEGRTAMLFDFSADGGSYQRSQLLANATRMRRRAEDAAAVAGIGDYWPAVEVTRIVPEDGGACVRF